MKSFIGEFYKTEKKAVERAKAKMKSWRDKVKFYVICAKNGYFVVSERIWKLLN